MEKNSLLHLTEEDIAFFHKGEISDRLKGLGISSIEDLKKVIASGEFTLTSASVNYKENL